MPEQSEKVLFYSDKPFYQMVLTSASKKELQDGTVIDRPGIVIKFKNGVYDPNIADGILAVQGKDGVMVNDPDAKVVRILRELANNENHRRYITVRYPDREKAEMEDKRVAAVEESPEYQKLQAELAEAKGENITTEDTEKKEPEKEVKKKTAKKKTTKKAGPK